MIEPITPSEVVEYKKKILPAEVINAFNHMIAKNFNGYQSFILQKDIENEIMIKLNITRTEVFSNNYLDVEDIYIKAGWKVTYDKPGYNESYDASFTFKK